MDQPRDKLLAAARILFAEKGFHSSPMSELATRAGVSVGQIYRLFPGKDAIIRAMVEHDVLDDYRMLASISEQVEGGAMSSAEALEAFARLPLSRPDEGLIYEILAEAYRNPAIAELIAEVTQGFRLHIRRLVCAARPTFSGIQLEAAEDLLLSLHIGIANRDFSGSKLPLADAPSYYSRMLMGALQALE